MDTAGAIQLLRQRGEMTMIAYLTGGFPTMPAFAEHLQDVAAGGADVIEVGVPFSDPIADGPTIQYSSQIALAGGARFEAILDTVRAANLATPVIVMSYLNPLLARGRDGALALLGSAGVSGLIAADLPVDEWDAWQTPARAAGVAMIAMAAPTSSDARLQIIADRSAAFVYVVSTTGITGVRAALDQRLPALLATLRKLTQTPLIVGFGISRPEHVQQLRGQADGVIVGSRLVEAIRAGERLDAVVRELKHATLPTYSK